MVTNLAKRLGELETVYRAQEKPGWVEAIEDMADADPLAFALWRVGFVLAQRRYLAETGQLPRNVEAHGDVWEERVAAELTRLEALGSDGWLAGARDLPPLIGWSDDLAAFFQDEYERTARNAADANDHLARLGWRTPLARAGSERPIGDLD